MATKLNTSLAAISVAKAPHLKNLDHDGDGKISRKDFPGLSTTEVRAIMMAARSTMMSIRDEVPDSFTLAGKRVVFTALQGQTRAQAESKAKAHGATVKRDVSTKVDVVVVGNDARTSKDEKAIRLTAARLADIMLIRESAFESLVNRTTAPALKLGSDDGSGPRVVIENTSSYPGDAPAYSFPKKLVDDVNAALQAYLREYFADAAESFPSAEAFRKAVADVTVTGWIVHPDEDPLGTDLKTTFVFTAYAEDIAGDHGLYVSVNRATGAIEGVDSFN